jgi:hypothetical protein
VQNSSFRLTLLLVYGVLLVLLVIPLFLVDTPPLLDYPNHLARSFITNRVTEDPDLARFYHINWHIVPNLGSDIVIALFALLVPIKLAGKLTLALVLGLTVTGVGVLHRALFGRWSWWPVCAALFAYNGVFLAGFLSFNLGVALLLFATALWVILGDARPHLRILIGIPVAMVLFFCHLLILAIYGVVIGGFELWRLWQARSTGHSAAKLGTDALVLAAPFLLPAVLFLATSTPDDKAIMFGPWEPYLWRRGLALAVRLYEPWLDKLTLILMAAVATGLLLVRRLKIAVGMVPGMTVLVVFTVTLPSWVMDTAFIPERFPLILILLGIAATRPILHARVPAYVFGGAMAAVFLMRLVVLGQNWLDHDRYMKNLYAAAQSIERGSTVLITTPFKYFWSIADRLHPHDPPWYVFLKYFANLMHMPAVLVMEHSVFMPTLFTHTEKQLLSFRPPFDSFNGQYSQRFPEGVDQLFPAGGGPPTTPHLQATLPLFDYILILYSDYLSDAQRQQLAKMHVLFDNGSIILLGNPVSLKAQAAR